MKRMRTDSFHPSPYRWRPPGKEYLHEVAVVLLESADAIVEDAAGLHERLAIQRSKPVRQHAGDESREESE